MKRLLIFLLVFLVGCAEEANLYEDENSAEIAGGQCPLILTIPTVNLMISSLDPLPPNLVVSVGGDAYDLDECADQNAAPYGIIKLNAYRTAGNLFVPFWPNSEDHKRFFPDFNAPASDAARVRIFSRPTCNDDPVLRYEYSSVPIIWTQIFAATGDECSGGGYMGSAQLDLQ